MAEHTETGGERDTQTEHNDKNQRTRWFIGLWGRGCWCSLCDYQSTPLGNMKKKKKRSKLHFKSSHNNSFFLLYSMQLPVWRRHNNHTMGLYLNRCPLQVWKWGGGEGDGANRSKGCGKGRILERSEKKNGGNNQTPTFLCIERVTG